MLSNKLTFSLASLVVFLMIGLCLPVDAQKIQSPLVVSLPVININAEQSVIPARSFVGYGASGSRAVLPAVAPTGIIAIPAPTVFDPTPDNVDLEEFFRLGGTLELLAPADKDDATFVDDPVADLGLGKHDLVISEIMWSLDVDGDPATDDDRRQWIEIYNTMEKDTKPIVSGADGLLKLRFVPFSHPEKPGDILPAYAEKITAERWRGKLHTNPCCEAYHSWIR